MTVDRRFRLAFDGLVAADAEPDRDQMDTRPNILRIDGLDVVREVTAAIRGLRDPIKTYATLSVAGEHQAVNGPVYVSVGLVERGCGDGCCGGMSPDELRVGKNDLLEALNEQHGRHARLTLTGRGYVPPDVQVTLAHHWNGHAPGTPLTVDLDQAMKLARGRKLLTADNERFLL